MPISPTNKSTNNQIPYSISTIYLLCFLLSNDSKPITLVNSPASLLSRLPNTFTSPSREWCYTLQPLSLLSSYDVRSQRGVRQTEPPQDLN